MIMNESCQAYVRVAEVVGKGLQCISCEVVLIPQDMVVSRTACALDASVAAQEEVKLCRMADLRVHNSTCKFNSIRHRIAL
jgi:hypothetical protein